jgi:hypothetical protein
MLAPQGYLYIFFLFSRFLILVQINKTYYMLHITSIIITSWPKFIYIKVISTCHVIDIYEHVLFNQASCEYVNIVQEIIKKGTNVNVKGEQKNKLH